MLAAVSDPAMKKSLILQESFSQETAFPIAAVNQGNCSLSIE